MNATIRDEYREIISGELRRYAPFAGEALKHTFGSDRSEADRSIGNLLGSVPAGSNRIAEGATKAKSPRGRSKAADLDRFPISVLVLACSDDYFLGPAHPAPTICSLDLSGCSQWGRQAV